MHNRRSFRVFDLEFDGGLLYLNRKHGSCKQIFEGLLESLYAELI
jgi:hypothetical protein